MVIDFAKYPIGRRVILKNSSPKNNEDYTNTNKIMAFDVVGDADRPVEQRRSPTVLNPDEPTMLLQPSEAVATRKLRLPPQELASGRSTARRGRTS